MSCALALCSAGAASPATSVAISEDSPSVTYDNTNKTESKASEEPFQVFDIYDAYSAVMATTTTTTVPAYTTTTCTVATTDHKPGELKNGPLNGIDVSEHQGVIDWARSRKPERSILLSSVRVTAEKPISVTNSSTLTW